MKSKIYIYWAAGVITLVTFGGNLLVSGLDPSGLLSSIFYAYEDNNSEFDRISDQEFINQELLAMESHLNAKKMSYGDMEQQFRDCKEQALNVDYAALEQILLNWDDSLMRMHEQIWQNNSDRFWILSDDMDYGEDDFWTIASGCIEKSEPQEEISTVQEQAQICRDFIMLLQSKIDQNALTEQELKEAQHYIKKCAE